MIAKFWNSLFRLADTYREKSIKAEYKEAKEMAKHKYDAIEEVQVLLQNAWDNGEENKEALDGCRPTNPHEELILQIAGLEIYQDPDDKQIFYELDNHHFDTEDEVLSYIIQNYNKVIKKSDAKWVRCEDGTYDLVKE